MNKLFAYLKKLPHTPHSRGEGETHILDAEGAFIDQYIARDEFGKLFGGYLLANDSLTQSQAFQYQGVWGKDKVRKLKQVLRDRGAEFEIVEIDGASRFIKVTAKTFIKG